MRNKQLTITQTIIFINILIFALQGFSTPARNFLISPYENYNFVSYFLAAFTHLSFMHIAFNMLFLYYIGTLLERFLGMVNYIIFYILAIILSGLAVDLFSTVYVAGASGVLYAMLSALLVFKYTYPSKFYFIPKFYLERLLLVNLFLTLLIPGISRIGHIGGALAGVIIAYVLLLFQKNNRY